MTRTLPAVALTCAIAALLSVAPTAEILAADASNPTVQARKEAMRAIGADTKTLGDMAKGKIPFDATVAQAAASNMASQAAEIPALFEAQEDDPVSKAKAEIWDNWEDFVSKGEALEIAATNAASSITDQASLGPALQSIGGSCNSCHTPYQE
ncbi:MAG: cytochrome c [Pseudomonadota bacterium]